MPHLLRRRLALLSGAVSIVPLLLAARPAAAQHEHHGAATEANRSVASTTAEYRGYLGGLDTLWVAFERGSNALSPVDSVVLGDLAEVLKLNHGLELRMWASAPDAPNPAGTGPRRTGSTTPLARRRRDAVRTYLRSLGVDEHQLQVQPADPRTFPPRIDWRGTGGTFFFVKSRPRALVTPARFAQVRVRALPGAEVFFIPKAVADRDSTRVLCNPPAVALQDRAGADSLVVRSYPGRPIVSVARGPGRVVRTRRHEVDPRNRPDLIDLATAAPEPRCQP